MSSTARTEPANVNDQPAAASASPNAGMAKNKVQHAKQGPTEASRLRLDALTIAGLTGTPYHGGASAARFFVHKAPGTSATPRSPTGSEDTIDSIQDSSVGDEDNDGGGSSVLSDELGEIAFTDDEDESIGSENGEGDGGASRDVNGSFTATAAVLGLEEVHDEGARRKHTSAGELGTEGPTGHSKAAGFREAEGSRSLELAATSGAPPADCSRTTVLPWPGATKTVTASGAECSSGGARSSAVSSADDSVAHSADASSRGNGCQQHEGHTPHASGSPSKEQRREQSRQQHSDNRVPKGRSTEMVGSSAENVIIVNGDSPGTRLRRGVSAELFTSTPAADAASRPVVSGADSGGGGVSSSSLQALPPGIVPTATCKVLVVGNAKCGKSSIISRFVNNRFSSDYRSTVGADYAMKDVALPGGRQVRLQLWDIAGQDRFAKLTRAYFRRAKGAVVVCDVTREGTFDAIVRWKEEIDLWCQNEGCELPVYLFANKCDLLTEVQDSFLAGARMEKTCRDSGFAGWYITSAKRGDNINTAMTNLLEHALKAEDQRNRGMKGEGERSPNSGNRGANGDDGGGPKGEAFQLSSRGRREGEGLGGQQGACCA
eukprot:g8522.t1